MQQQQRSFANKVRVVKQNKQTSTTTKKLNISKVNFCFRLLENMKALSSCGPPWNTMLHMFIPLQTIFILT